MRTVVENNENLNKTHQLKNIGYIYIETRIQKEAVFMIPAQGNRLGFLEKP